jgi:hypothetical protein
MIRPNRITAPDPSARVKDHAEGMLADHSFFDRHVMVSSMSPYLAGQGCEDSGDTWPVFL